MNRFQPLALSALSALAISTGAQTVHVVDNSGGGDFNQIAAAVSAASSGDLLLVRDGTYNGFTIDGKALTIVEGTGHTAVVEGEVEIRNLAANQTVELIDFKIDADAFVIIIGPPNDTALLLEDNLGAVELDGMVIEAPQQVPGAEIDNCANVTFSQCTLNGGGFGGSALESNDSNVHLFSSTLQGGDGGGPIGGATAGATIIGGTVFAAGCSFIGGAGANGVNVPPFGCTPGTNGADALELFGSDPLVRLRDCALLPGAGGSNGGCGGGVDGDETWILTGSIETLDGPARSYDLQSVAREGEVATIEFQGEAGELAVWLFSLQSTPSYTELVAGSVIPGGALTIVNFGPLPAGGALTIPFTIPSIPIASLKLFEQAVYVSGEHGYLAGDPRISVLLQDAF